MTKPFLPLVHSDTPWDEFYDSWTSQVQFLTLKEKVDHYEIYSETTRLITYKNNRSNGKNPITCNIKQGISVNDD